VIQPYESYDSRGGARVVRIHYNADPEKDAQWAADERARGWTEAEWELEMELNDLQAPGALWDRVMLASARTHEKPANIVQIAIGVDPSVTDPELRKDASKKPDECGIVVAGLMDDSRAVILNDLSGILSPSKWAKAAVGAYNHYRANVLAAERNNGGELVRTTLRTVGPSVNISLVWAAIGKRPRAEPVAALYEQGRILHLWPKSAALNPLRYLETEMCTWRAGDPSAKSPNRIDAMVWALHALGLCADGEARRSTRRKSSEDRP
jgi:phage terminase large subunit-like protein